MQEERAVAMLRADVAKEVAFWTGTRLRGYSITFRPHDTLLVLKATAPNGKKKVAFIAASTEYDCFFLLYRAIHTTHKILTWRDDSFT